MDPSNFRMKIHEISALAAKRYVNESRSVPDIAMNCIFFTVFEHDFQAFVTWMRVKYKNGGKSIFWNGAIFVTFLMLNLHAFQKYLYETYVLFDTYFLFLYFRKKIIQRDTSEVAIE